MITTFRSAKIKTNQNQIQSIPSKIKPKLLNQNQLKIKIKRKNHHLITKIITNSIQTNKKSNHKHQNLTNKPKFYPNITPLHILQLFFHKNNR